ncbi:MAG: YebC/PmpR family DNA-binding transcriptional regulator [Candidatus Paceibacterota bacterium]|jgi:YebC/PmpR family DNA-binding regulatory protein
MSGHNKWSKVKNKKAVSDAKKSKIFSKYSRLITLEAKKANGNTSSPGLKSIIEKARAANMPSDNIDRAVKKATEAGSQNMEVIVYEAYGPGGVALIIDALTDNRNKAAQEIKFILSEHGSALAAPGSASWAFEKTHEGWMPKTMAPISEEDGAKLEALIEALEENDEVQEIFTNAE